MARKDIYKIDNYFITIGYVLLIVGGLSMALDPFLWNEVSIREGTQQQASYKFENKNGRTLEQIRKEKGDRYWVEERSFPLIRTIMAANGLILLLIGSAYRSREKKIISVWRALEQTGEARVPELSISLGLSREFIIKHLKEINAQQQAAYTYDSRNDKIVNNRLLTEFLVQVDCVNCGGKISQKISLDLSNPPRCQYCGTGVSVDHLNKLKQEVLLAVQVPAEGQQSEFSIGVFVALLLFFWPGAIVYYVVKKKQSIDTLFGKNFIPSQNAGKITGG